MARLFYRMSLSGGVLVKEGLVVRESLVLYPTACADGLTLTVMRGQSLYSAYLLREQAGAILLHTVLHCWTCFSTEQITPAIH